MTTKILEKMTSTLAELLDGLRVTAHVDFIVRLITFEILTTRQPSYRRDHFSLANCCSNSGLPAVSCLTFLE